MTTKELCAAALLAVLVPVASGCARGGNAPAGASGTPASAPAIVGDAAHGKAVYVANCSQCHGATGVEGGIGPSLHDERARKGDAAAIAWIEDPQPPMPKLYPGTLGEKDVADVAAYVESL